MSWLKKLLCRLLGCEFISYSPDLWWCKRCGIYVRKDVCIFGGLK